MINLEDRRERFAEELRRRMSEEELRVGDIAQYCKIHPNNISNYLQAKSFPNPWILSNIATMLCCTTNDLLDFEEADDDTICEYDIDSFDGEEEFTMHVRNRLDNVMHAEHISVEDVSIETGFNERTIRQWLGRYRPGPSLMRTSELIQLCEVIGCTPTDLLGY